MNAFDKFFVVEVLNDLSRNGFVSGGKAECMLRDLSRELREESRTRFPASRLKREFCKAVGKNNW